MKHHDRDRLLLSILLASILYAGLWVFMEVSDWELFDTPPRNYGPLFVELTPQPDLAPAEPDRETESSQSAPAREDVKPEDSEDPPAEPKTEPESARPEEKPVPAIPEETVPAAPERTEAPPVKTEPADTSSAGAVEASPAPDPSPVPVAPRTEDQTVESTAGEAEDDPGPVLPPTEESETESWGENQFVYDDDPPEETINEAINETTDNNAAQTGEDESLFDTSALDNLLSTLPDSSDNAGSSDGQEEPESNQTTDVAEDQIRDDIIYDLQDLQAKRQLLFSPEPEVPADFNAEGRTQFEVVVTFTLQPDGFLKDLNILRSSGYSEVDTAVQVAMRKWKFEPVPGYRDSEMEGITVTLLYVYGVK